MTTLSKLRRAYTVAKTPAQKITAGLYLADALEMDGQAEEANALRKLVTSDEIYLDSESLKTWRADLAKANGDSHADRSRSPQLCPQGPR